MSYQFPHETTFGLIGRYQDGQHFARLVLMPGLNQGIEAVRAFRNGRTRFTFSMTVDARLQKGFGRITAILDASNVFNQALEVEESSVTGATSRLTSAVQPPRVIQLGIRSRSEACGLQSTPVFNKRAKWDAGVSKRHVTRGFRPSVSWRLPFISNYIPSIFSANDCGHVAKPEHVPSRLHLPDRDMFTETTRLFACVLVVQWLAVVAFTYWMARTHVVAAFFAGGVLSLIPMALAIVRGRGARQALAERTAALHDSQERYRAIVDRAEGIFLADAATKELIECNAALAALLGYSADETARLTLYNFDGDSRDSVDAAVRQLTDGKRPLQLDRRYRHKDQSIVQVTLHASVFLQGTRAIVCGAVRDVTALRDSESQLRQAQKMEAIGRLAGGDRPRLQQPADRHPRLQRPAARGRSGRIDPAAATSRRCTRGGRARGGADPQLLAFSRRQVAGARGARPQRRRRGDARRCCSGCSARTIELVTRAASRTLRRRQGRRRPDRAGDRQPRPSTPATPCPTAAGSSIETAHVELAGG